MYYVISNILFEMKIEKKNLKKDLLLFIKLF